MVNWRHTYQVIDNVESIICRVSWVNPSMLFFPHVFFQHKAILVCSLTVQTLQPEVKVHTVQIFKVGVKVHTNSDGDA